jgi:hypothetical protein
VTQTVPPHDCIDNLSPHSPDDAEPMSGCKTTELSNIEPAFEHQGSGQLIAHGCDPEFLDVGKCTEMLRKLSGVSSLSAANNHTVFKNVSVFGKPM